ncbi:MAG TPA: citrate/2-methylcitrate synthase [Thermoguttaceae bacterium]|nr:citrate/2-methylcitrate synthase [Thermoguttaceae bacterium]
MRAQSLADILKKGDRVAVSNITGREASNVSYISQLYCGNVVGGWSLGKGGQTIEVPGGRDIPVFGQFDELIERLPEGRKPNKVVVYSPPAAVYGDVKEVIEHGKSCVDTIFVITENVSVEVTAKLRRLCNLDNFDILGCNTLGVINAHDAVRVGAVGGDSPAEAFTPGSACILSNSGNMVNTMASYLQSAGLGVSYGIATGKDPLILTPMKELLRLAQRDPNTRLVVLYIEPGGVYEQEAIEMARAEGFKKPMLVYVAGSFAEGTDISLGHAGAVVDGPHTSATAKMALFDEYLGLPVFDPENAKQFTAMVAETRRGLRVKTLHDLVPAATSLMTALQWDRDMTPKSPLVLRPWLVNLGAIAKRLPSHLVPHVNSIIEPYGSLIKKTIHAGLGQTPPRQSMRNASHASSNDGVTPRLYGYSVLNLMKQGSFVDAVLLAWLGHPVRQRFESRLVEMCLIAALTNGPGTISAQAAKLSASAGNGPNTALMTTLGAIGEVHGGNGKVAAKMLIDVFGNSGLVNPYDRGHGVDLDKLTAEFVSKFKKAKSAAKEAGIDYKKVPCLGHPVFNTDAVNHDPRERVIHAWLEEQGLYNVFLDFYHRLAAELVNQQATNKVHAVNVDAAITCVLLGVAWPLLVEKKITVERVLDLPFLAFALGRVAGGAGEYLDHRESGTDMDMRVPVSECKTLCRAKD